MCLKDTTECLWVNTDVVCQLSTCSSAEDLHHRRGEEAHPVCPPLGVVDVTFPPAVWVLLQDLTWTNHEHTSAEMFVSLQIAVTDMNVCTKFERQSVQ